MPKSSKIFIWLLYLHFAKWVMAPAPQSALAWECISAIQHARTHTRVNSGFIKRTAANLSFKLLGDSLYPHEPPLLLLHGLLGNKKLWEGIGKTIQSMTRRAVFTVDLRNHGDSPHMNSHKYTELADDVLELLQKLSIKRTTLVGHSMGGRAAMCVALKKPGAVASLIVVDTSPISTCRQFEEEVPKVLGAMKAVEFEKIEKKKVSRAKKYASKQLSAMIHDKFAIESILSNINVRKDGTIGWTCNLDTLLKHYKHIISFPNSMKKKKYSGPTLFLGGQLSEYIPADDLPGIREMFPQAVVTYIRGAGHNVHVDNAKSFLELVIAFVKNNNLY